MNQFPWNRLWVQFSLVISVVVVFAAITLLVTLHLLRPPTSGRCAAQ